MFDVQVRGHTDAELPPEVRNSIAAYYRRVTTTARPMNRLVAAAMLATLAAIVVQLAHDDAPAWVSWISLALTIAAVAVAAAHTVPAAVRLGARDDTVAVQSRLARGICRDHLFCVGAIATVLALQLIAG